MPEKLIRILHVDDDSDIRMASRMALETIGGFSVEMCGSGKEALERAPAFQPQLLLLDVMMPVMDGPATLNSLRELPQFAATPAIFITSNLQPHEIASYRNLGVLDVIPKPFDPLNLSRQIQAIWDRQHG